MAAAMDHSSRARPDTTAPSESPPDLGRVTSRPSSRAGTAAAGRQVPRLRVVEPTLTARPSATRSTPHSLRHDTPAGTGLLAPSAPTSTSSGNAPTSRSTATRSYSRPCASRSSTSLQAGARAEQRADPRQGPDRTGYDGHTFWDTERYVLPVLTYTVPRRPPTRCAGDTPPSTWRASARRQLGHAAPHSHGAPFAARSAPATGRPAPLRSTSTPTSPTQSSLSGRDRRQALRARVVSSCSSRPRGCGARSATTTRRGGFASTASPAPTSTARSPTTTSTRTCSRSGTCRRRGRRRTAPRHAATLRADLEEAAAWRDAADDMLIPWDEKLGVHPQSEGFTDHGRWDFENAAEQYPLLLHFPYFELYRKQVVKQADLVLALHWCGERVHRRGEGARLRLLRGAHRPRLLPLGLHPGRHGGRSRPPRARLRLLRRGRAHGPARPRAEHPRRPPHRLAGRSLDRCRRRLRRHARPRLERSRERVDEQPLSHGRQRGRRASRSRARRRAARRAR